MQTRREKEKDVQCKIRLHTIPYHTIPYHTIPYHTIPYHTIPYRTVPYHTIPYRTIPYHTTCHFLVDLQTCKMPPNIQIYKALCHFVFHYQGLSPRDVQVIELHDCFSVNELLTYEGLGLCAEGKL